MLLEKLNILVIVIIKVFQKLKKELFTIILILNLPLNLDGLEFYNNISYNTYNPITQIEKVKGGGLCEVFDINENEYNTIKNNVAPPIFKSLYIRKNLHLRLF